MAISPEDFTPEHFAKLVRGVTIAAESFQRAYTEREHTDGVIADLQAQLEENRGRIADLNDELADAIALSDELRHRALDCDYLRDATRAMVEMVGDIERGIASVADLAEQARDIAERMGL